jgi:hypothetical protein
MFDWLRRWRSGTQSKGYATPPEPAPKVDPIEELLRIVGEAQDHDAEDERRLGDPKWRNRPISHLRRGLKPRSR